MCARCICFKISGVIPTRTHYTSHKYHKLTSITCLPTYSLKSTLCTHTRILTGTTVLWRVVLADLCRLLLPRPRQSWLASPSGSPSTAETRRSPARGSWQARKKKKEEMKRRGRKKGERKGNRVEVSVKTKKKEKKLKKKMNRQNAGVKNTTFVRLHCSKSGRAHSSRCTAAIPHST